MCLFGIRLKNNVTLFPKHTVDFNKAVNLYIITSYFIVKLDNFMKLVCREGASVY